MTVYCVEYRVGTGDAVTLRFESMTARELFVLSAGPYFGATVLREWLEAEPEQEVGRA